MHESSRGEEKREREGNQVTAFACAETSDRRKRDAAAGESCGECIGRRALWSALWSGYVGLYAGRRERGGDVVGSGGGGGGGTTQPVLGPFRLFITAKKSKRYEANYMMLSLCASIDEIKKERRRDGTTSEYSSYRDTLHVD